MKNRLSRAFLAYAAYAAFEADLVKRCPAYPAFEADLEKQCPAYGACLAFEACPAVPDAPARLGMQSPVSFLHGFRL